MNGITAALTGRLGADADLRYTAQGRALATFSVAVDDDKAEQGKAEWVRATVWGEDAEELAPRLVKGVRVYLEGRVRLDQWQAQDGQQRSTLKLSAWVCQPMGLSFLRARQDHRSPAGARRGRGIQGRQPIEVGEALGG